MSAYLGDLRDEWQRGLCSYAPSPGEFHCDRDSTWHGFLLDEAGQEIKAMMSSCDEHVALMRLSADYVHPIQHPCNIPASRFRWPENECYTEWDESELLAGEALAVAS